MDTLAPSYVRTCRLIAFTAWLLQHRILLNRGLVLRRKGLSSETASTLVVGTTSSIWTAAVVYHGATVNGSSSLLQFSQIVLTQAPLLVQSHFLIWIAKWITAVWSERTGRSPNLWQATRVRGPFNWEPGIRSFFYTAFFTALFAAVMRISAVHIMLGGELAMSGILNIAGLVVFFLGGTPKHPYNSATHSYSDETIRIILPTTHHEGTVYQLPSSDKGFNAVWSIKVANEHLEADREIMILYQHMRSNRWLISEPLQRLRTTMARFHERILLSDSQARLLAVWIYLDRLPGDSTIRSISCNRAADVHLIGRDLIFALCHAEYLVFMSQRSLPEETRAKLGRLRLVRRSGAESAPGHTIGYLPGLEGYREAVRYVYDIFDLPVEDEALNFHVEPPVFSTALSKSPSSIDVYVAELWDLSTSNCESTFSALYFFTTVWFMELGNVNGFHIFPLRCRGTEGDLVSQQIMWRQLWYSVGISQLISFSPVVLGAFFGGLFP